MTDEVCWRYVYISSRHISYVRRSFQVILVVIGTQGWWRKGGKRHAAGSVSPTENNDARAPLLSRHLSSQDTGCRRGYNNLARLVEMQCHLLSIHGLVMKIFKKKKLKSEIIITLSAPLKNVY